MCDVGAVGSAFNFVGDIEKARAEKAAAHDNATTLRRNAMVAELAAADAVRRGDAQAAIVESRAEAVQGRQRAGFAGQGVDVNSGSAARTVLDTAMVSAVDMETIRINAEREAWGLRTQAEFMREAADQSEASGQVVASATIVGGLGQGISSGIGAADRAGYFKDDTSNSSPGLVEI